MIPETHRPHERDRAHHALAVPATGAGGNLAVGDDEAAVTAQAADEIELLAQRQLAVAAETIEDVAAGEDGLVAGGRRPEARAQVDDARGDGEARIGRVDAHAEAAAGGAVVDGGGDGAERAVG